MPSFVWDRDPQEAMDNPYEYEAQNQFIREAEKILEKFSDELKVYDMKFTKNDRSKEKAIWLLQNDSLDSLRDILSLLKQKKHKTAGKIFRDINESLDLVSYFHSGTAESAKKLNDWYDDKIIPHRVYREYIKKTRGEKQANALAEGYSNISKFSHRTYKVLLYSYVLGKDDLLAYDGYRENDILVLPQTIAMYLALLADYIKFFSIELADKQLVNKKRIKDIMQESFEKKSVERRFVPIKRIHGRS